MSRVIQRLNLAAICLLGAVLSCMLAARIWPGARLIAGDREQDDQRARWKTLEVYPSSPRDAVKLVRIMKGGKELLPGRDQMPELPDQLFPAESSIDDWLRDVSLVLRNQTSKSIVDVGVSIVFARDSTVIPYNSTTDKPGSVIPKYIQYTLHWGQIPAKVAAALKARYVAEVNPPLFDGRRHLLEGKEPLQFAPGDEITLSFADRVGMDRADVAKAQNDARKPFYDVIRGIAFFEGMDEAFPRAKGLVEARKTKAYSAVKKFNIGVNVVYFQDGTRWGNYGYGYARLNPDGTFTRMDSHYFPGELTATSAGN